MGIANAAQGRAGACAGIAQRRLHDFLQVPREWGLCKRRAVAAQGLHESPGSRAGATQELLRGEQVRKDCAGAVERHRGDGTVFLQSARKACAGAAKRIQQWLHRSLAGGALAPHWRRDGAAQEQRKATQERCRSFAGGSPCMLFRRGAPTAQAELARAVLRVQQPHKAGKN